MTDSYSPLHRVHNFSAGPATLPTPVLLQAQAELLDWQNLGASVMEISHRSAEFVAMAHAAQSNLRKLMQIPDNYQVLFMQGGASLQFSAIPLNLLSSKNSAKPVADYLTTGAWSKKALKEAQRYSGLGLGDINEVATSAANKFTTVPDIATFQTSSNAAYFHYCANESMHGVQIFEPPEVNAPVVADMSSCILSQPIDVTKYGMIYAGAQKNIGPAGLVIVIIRDDLLNAASAWCPLLMNYAHLAQKESMSNTPPTYSWYLAGLAFQWLLDMGGVEAIAPINQQKAKLLYDTIDNSQIYQNLVDPQYRSIMNIPFSLKNPNAKHSVKDVGMAGTELDQQFLQQAKQAGLCNLKGHRDVGGMRASIYNAVSLQSVQALVAFMHAFEAKLLQQKY